MKKQSLLSQGLTIDEKLNIIGTEYQIPIEESFRKDATDKNLKEVQTIIEGNVSVTV